MGYFSNGSEGHDYEAKWCDHCVHINPLLHGCPCWDMHLLYNYEEANNDNSLLHKMIPIDKDGNNMQCLFFVKKEE